MTTKEIVSIALFAAVMAALALFPPLPLPVIGVPITAQSMGPMLAGSIIGARRGFLSMVLFVALVALGLPLLAGGRGGLAVFVGPTAGFILSWPFAAALIGLLHERAATGLTASMVYNFVGGIVLVYVIGIVWLAASAHLPLLKAAMGSALFIPGDLIKVVLTALIADAVRRSYPMMAAPAAPR